MAVLAVPVEKPFEVASDKVELFEKNVKDSSVRILLQAKIKKYDKGDTLWDLEK